MLVNSDVLVNLKSIESRKIILPSSFNEDIDNDSFCLEKKPIVIVIVTSHCSMLVKLSILTNFDSHDWYILEIYNNTMMWNLAMQF